MKLSDEDKREIIRLNKEEGVSQKRLAKMFNIGIRHIEELISRYNLHGDEILVKRPNRKYSPEFKMVIINQYLSGESKRSLALSNDIQKSMVISWIKRYEKDGYNGLIDKKKGRPPRMKKDEDEIIKPLSDNNSSAKIDSADKARIKLLEKKNQELEAEVAYLKKLNALVQERKKLQSKKK